MIPCQKITEPSATQKFPLGTRYFDENSGKVYYYVKANEALAKGAIVTGLVALFDGDCDASSGKVLNDAASTFTANTVGAHVKINAGTNSIDQDPNRVTAYAANALTLETAWGSDLTTAEDYVVYNEWLVEECDAAGESITGVAPVAFTTQYYGFIQTGGDCAAVKVAGNTDAVVAHEGLVSSAAAGVAKGLTAAGTTVDEAEKANITALVPTALAAQLIPATLNCLP